MPNFAAIYLIISLSSLGMPLLNGFIGEFAILRGVFELEPGGKVWAAWGVLGIVLGAAYLLWLFQRTMFGPVTKPENEKLPDLNAREFATLIPLVVLAFWIGIYPKPFLNYLEVPTKKIVTLVKPGYYENSPIPSDSSLSAPNPDAATQGHKAQNEKTPAGKSQAQATGGK
jgi:NADH-quinone oxidoreductase subunit M